MNPEKALPVGCHADNGHTVVLPEFNQTVRALDQLVDVDYYIPGCPPTPRILHAAVQTLLGPDRPSKGTVLAPDRALCDECPRRETKPEKLSIAEFRRTYESIIDEEKCLLAQGFVCMGPATRAGCEATCIRGNMPCSGCFGPPSRVRDQGAKILSCLASLMEGKEDGEIGRVLNTIPDPVGTFYRYCLPGSLLRRKRLTEQQASK